MTEYSYTLQAYTDRANRGLNVNNEILYVLGKQDSFRRSFPSAFMSYCNHRIAILEQLVNYEMLVKLKSEDGTFPFLCTPEDYPTVTEMAKALFIPVVHLEDQLSILQTQGFIEYYDSDTVSQTFFVNGQDPDRKPFATLNYWVREVLAGMSSKERHDLFVNAVYKLKVITTKRQ